MHVEAVKNIGKTSDRLICIYELKMHKRFVEGRKQLQKRPPYIDEMIRLWKVAKMDRFGHFAKATSIQNGQKCPIFRA